MLGLGDEMDVTGSELEGFYTKKQLVERGNDRMRLIVSTKSRI